MKWSKTMTYVLGTVGCALSITLAAVDAKDCRATKTVIESAKGQKENEKAGGHVQQHILNETTLTDKTLFNGWTDFTSAFTKWSGEDKPNPKPKNCAAECRNCSETDCVKATDVNITAGTECKKADSHGKCISAKAITDPPFVMFEYVNNDNTKNVWALVSAYPTFPGFKCPTR